MNKKNSVWKGFWRVPGSSNTGRDGSATRPYGRCIRRLATIPVVLYQITFSPDHGPFKAMYPYGFCRFYPSCSEYTRLAILKHGILKGYAMGSWRVARCNPCSKGGVDQP